MLDKYLLFQYSGDSLWNEMVQKRIELRDINLKLYLEQDLFSFLWWLKIIAFILVWAIWWKWVDKTRLLEIIAYGLMVSSLATVIDLIGMNMVLWGYPITLLPFTLPLYVADLGMIPVIYMLVYQNFSNWKSFIRAVFVMAVIVAFVVEPLNVWTGIYEMNNWNYLYSFPIYIISAILLKWIINKILFKQNSHHY
ncbi:MAG TPA: hypothetical protein DEP72_08835 [Clostridiales bacterium]|nr:MAG: hypothetical protein A2Y18_03775 [Clostridiales bacterium GWD2_32_19]HCC08244.1 hypothetical protein [Clostridiales bacterium]